LRDLGGNALELVRLAPEQRHPGAERGELVRRAASQSGTAPGHDPRLALEQPVAKYRPVTIRLRHFDAIAFET